MQPPMTSFEDINDPTKTMNAALILFAIAFQLFAPTNNNQRTSSNPRNHQIAQPVMNMSQDRQIHNVGGNGLRVLELGIKPDATTIEDYEEAGLQLQAEKFDFMDAARDLDEIEEVNANCILMANLQQTSTFGTQHDKAPVYDTDGSAEVNMVNCNMRATNAELKYELARYKLQEQRVKISQEKYDKLEKCYQKFVYQEECHTRKINALHLNSAKQITTLNDEISNLNKQLSKEKSSISSLIEEKKKLKHDFKTREDKFLDKEVDLEVRIKDLDNILLTRDQTVQTMHMLNPKPDSLHHSNQKMALGYPNPLYLKKAQLKQQSLYNGNLLLEEHDPLAVYDSKETLKLAQESHENMRFLKKEIKPANYAKINHLSGVKSSLVTLQRVVKQKMTLEVHNWSSSAHKEEADESLDKQNSKELEIERLLKASVSHDIMSIVQNGFVDAPSDIRTELDHTKEKIELCIIKKEKEYDVLWNNWYTKWTSVTPHVDKPKLSVITPLSKKLHASMPSHSVPQPREFNVVKHRNVIAPGMFNINPSQTPRVDLVPNKQSSASIRTNPITNSQRHVTIKEIVSSDTVTTSSTGLVHTARTKRPQPKGKTKNARVPSASKSSEVKKNVIVEEHRRTLLLSKNQKTMSSECNNIKLAIQNDKSKSVCANCCLNLSVVRRLGLFQAYDREHQASHQLCVEVFGNCTLWERPNCCYFRRNTCFIRDLDGVDLLKGNHSTNIYTINLYDMASASPICLMACATPTKSWLWHQRLNHFNFDTINDLAKNDLVFGLPKFKYAKEHLCPSCEQGKGKRASHPPKPVLNSKQRLHLLHMDLCGPMQVASINGKRYVLVIVDDYSRYTSVHFLITKDEMPEVIKNSLKKIYVRLQAHVIIVRTDNGTEFKNHVLKEYLDSVGITHETSAAKTPQQNRVVDAKIIHCSELELTYAPSTITHQRPSEWDLDILFEPLHNEYLGGRPSEAPRAIPAALVQQKNLTISPTASAADNGLTAVDEFPLPEDFPTASEERFPLLSVTITLSNKVVDLISREQQVVIEFGDSYEAPQDDAATGLASKGSAKKKGMIVAITTEDMQKRKNDVKARTTLLLALPDEHQLRFSKYKTAQELWAAILKTFSGNEATKKTKKNQLKQQYGNFKAEGLETLKQTFNKLHAIVSHLEFIDIEIEQDDLNQKFLTSLAPEWLMYTIIWRNRSDLDTMSLDDVYNHLKVYEPEVQKKSESNSQNMAFISSAKNSNGNGEVNSASIPTASPQVSPASANDVVASISLDTSKYNGSQTKYEDINQIDEEDIEEMDIKWNIALLSMRADRY
nr:integrase, catalytic region, zinc finger, CCHC-type, peptidase aspartic, catalytic [Tanacetum cinerariifolium]